MNHGKGGKGAGKGEVGKMIVPLFPFSRVFSLIGR